MDSHKTPPHLTHPTHPIQLADAHQCLVVVLKNWMLLRQLFEWDVQVLMGLDGLVLCDEMDPDCKVKHEKELIWYCKAWNGPGGSVQWDSHEALRRWAMRLGGNFKVATRSISMLGGSTRTMMENWRRTCRTVGMEEKYFIQMGVLVSIASTFLQTKELRTWLTFVSLRRTTWSTFQIKESTAWRYRLPAALFYWLLSLSAQGLWNTMRKSTAASWA